MYIPSKECSTNGREKHVRKYIIYLAYLVNNSHTWKTFMYGQKNLRIFGQSFGDFFAYERVF